MPPAGVPLVGVGSVPTMYGAPMPMYGQPSPAYGYPMDPNAWQQQPIPPPGQPTHPNLQQLVPPQHVPNPTVYGWVLGGPFESVPVCWSYLNPLYSAHLSTFDVLVYLSTRVSINFAILPFIHLPVIRFWGCSFANRLSWRVNLSLCMTYFCVVC